MDITAKVRRFITDNFLFRQGDRPLADTDSFLDAGLIDSTGILELVAFLEQAFSINVADDDILPQNLDSVSRIAAYVHRERSARRAEAEGVHHAS